MDMACASNVVINTDVASDTLDTIEAMKPTGNPTASEIQIFLILFLRRYGHWGLGAAEGLPRDRRGAARVPFEPIRAAEGPLMDRRGTAEEPPSEPRDRRGADSFE
jgi:hypothetical protein